MSSSDGPVIVGFIPNPLGHAAVRIGILEAGRRGVALVAVHSITDRTAAEQAAFEEQELDALERALTNTRIRHEVALVDFSASAAKDLVRLASARRAQLVVIGVRSRSTLGKLVFGSNALEIIGTCPCPVLTVREESVD